MFSADQTTNQVIPIPLPLSEDVYSAIMNLLLYYAHSLCEANNLGRADTVVQLI